MNARSSWRRWGRYARRLALALACFAPSAAAQPITDVAPIAYDGSLYLNGEAVDGLVEMRFSLWTEAEGGVEIWAEEWTVADSIPVTVRAGRFKALLGSITPFELPDLRERASSWLSISVRPEGADAWHPLGGRQQAKDFVYAARTIGAPAQFAVFGDLSADNVRFSLPSGVAADDVTILGELDISRTLMLVNGLLTATDMTVFALYGTTVEVIGEALFSDLRVHAELTQRQDGSAVGQLVAGQDVDARRLDRVDMVGTTILNPDERSQGLSALDVGGVGMGMRLPSPVVQVGPDAMNGTLVTSRFRTYTGIGGSLRTNSSTVNTGAYTQPTGTLQVAGTASVGRLHAPNCRLCIQFHRAGAFHMCVRLDSAGARSGTVNPPSNWSAFTEGQLILDCNNNANSAGAGAP